MVYMERYRIMRKSPTIIFFSQFYSLRKVEYIKNGGVKQMPIYEEET